MRVGIDVTGRIARVMTIRRHPTSASAKVKVAVRTVEVGRPDEISRKTFGDPVLECERKEVRRVIDPTAPGRISRGAQRRQRGRGIVLSWIAGRAVRPCPAYGNTIFGGERLRCRHPASLPLALVLKFQKVGDIPMKVFVDRPHRHAPSYGVLDPYLSRVFIRDIGIVVSLRRIGVKPGQVRLPIHFHVPLIGSHQVDRLGGVSRARADGIAKAAIIARVG